MVSAVIDAALWRPYYAYDYRELAHSASAKSPNPARDTSLDGAANGSAGVNGAPNVDARINGATHLGGQRCGDHEDGSDSTDYRKLAEHRSLLAQYPFNSLRAFAVCTIEQDWRADVRIPRL